MTDTVAWIFAYLAIGTIAAELGMRKRFLVRGGSFNIALTYICVMLFWLPGLIIMLFNKKDSQ